MGICFGVRFDYGTSDPCAFVWWTATTMMMTTYRVVSSLGPFKPSLIAVNLQKM